MKFSPACRILPALNDLPGYVNRFDFMPLVKTGYAEFASSLGLESSFFF
jgi:hypothetical protein